jgi:uncharacterized repeat protein (TIGR04052 family)
MFGRYVILFSMASLIAACSESTSRVEIPFVSTFGGAEISCDIDSAVKLTDLRFYVHNLRLLTADGEERAVELDVDSWQQANLALIDLENGAGNCLNGTTVLNTSLRGAVTGTEFRGLVFTLGVPFSSNHGDPLIAAAPLGDADMHWHWRGGYKFFRAGIRTADDSFWIHLGSTGCEGTIQNITGCAAPNRVEVRLEDFRYGDSVAVDLAALVSEETLSDLEPSDCSSGPAESSCTESFAAFGLSHAGSDAGPQQVFVVDNRP